MSPWLLRLLSLFLWRISIMWICQCMAFAVDVFEQFCPTFKRLPAKVALLSEMISCLSNAYAYGIRTGWGRFHLGDKCSDTGEVQHSRSARIEWVMKPKSRTHRADALRFIFASFLRHLTGSALPPF